jgi:hypothetical protein
MRSKRRTILSAAVVATLLVAAAACSSDDSVEAPAFDAGGGNDASVNPGADASGNAGGDAGAKDAAIDATNGADVFDAGLDVSVSSYGNIALIIQLDPEAGTTDTVVIGGFATETDVLGTGCPQATFGACTVTDCRDGGFGMVLGRTGSYGGKLHVRGGAYDVDLDAITIAGGYLYENFYDGGIFSGGETITAWADGGTIAPFAVSATAPARVIVVSTPPGDGGAVEFSREAGVPIAWSGALDAGEIVFNIQATSGPSVLLQCVFPAPAGSATVPPEALAAVTQTGSYSAGVRAQAVVDAGGFAIKLDLEGYTITPLGRPFSGTYTVK